MCTPELKWATKQTHSERWLYLNIFLSRFFYKHKNYSSSLQLLDMDWLKGSPQAKLKESYDALMWNLGH